METAATVEGSTLAKERYLTFRLDDEVYGVPVLHVREIIELQDITPVPRAAHHIRGVVNLRGKVLPLMDLKLRFGLSAIEPTDLTVIIVLQPDKAPFGVLVDEVLDVQNMDSGTTAEPPDLGSDAKQQFLAGVGRVRDRIVFLLDLDAPESKVLQA